MGVAGAARAQDAAVATPPSVRIALVAPEPGDDYFNALRQGMLEAAAAVEGTQVTYTSPASRDPARQAETITSLIQQTYDAIIVAPDAGDAVLEACGQAVRAGIKVISIENALPPDLRHLHIATPDPVDLQPQQLALLSTARGKKGEFALMTAAANDPVSAAVAKALQKEGLKPEYLDLPLICTLPTEPGLQQAYAAAVSLVQTYPTLTGILAVTRDATLGAARAVKDLGRAPAIKVTGTGLPSKLAALVKGGSIPAFLTWNPADIGFAAATAAIGLARQSLLVQPGVPLTLGRLGDQPVLEGRILRLGKLVAVNAENIDALAEEY
jgi:rhamnose transport system substrate-binding protein